MQIFIVQVQAEIAASDLQKHSNMLSRLQSDMKITQDKYHSLASILLNSVQENSSSIAAQQRGGNGTASAAASLLSSQQRVSDINSNVTGGAVADVAAQAAAGAALPGESRSRIRQEMLRATANNVRSMDEKIEALRRILNEGINNVSPLLLAQQLQQH